MIPLYDEAGKLQPQIVSWRRALHQMPETGLYLPETAQYVKDRLKEMGIACQEYEGHSGLTACIGSGDRTVALRADMDGLPVQEESGLPYASQNGKMHACGHDGHTAILLGAAKLLKAHEEELAGRVKFIFQPAEEGPGGARQMVEEGVLRGVDGIFALHTGALAGNFPPGEVAVSPADTFAADDEVVIEVTGRGGHGSSPHQCVDPVAAATLIINNIQYIVSREVDAREVCVITISCVKAGDVCNIIPGTASIRGTIRNSSPEVREYVLRRIREIAEGTSKIMHADCSVQFEGYPALVNDRRMTESFLHTAGRYLKPEEIHILSHGLLSGEDAAFFFREVPGCYFFLSSLAPCPLDGQMYPHHHPRFCLDEAPLWKGSGLMAQTAADWLEENAKKKE